MFGEKEQVAIDVQRIMLRGDLPVADLEIRYSTDGSDPEDAAIYDRPFVLHETATVKAVVLRDGGKLMTLSQVFVRGERPRISDPRWIGGAVRHGLLTS